MKKTISYIMVICVLVSLGGCVWDPAITYFDYDELKEQIATVELINYENENPKIIKDASNVLPFDFAKMEVIETLAADKIDDFVTDLSETGFMDYSSFAKEPVGICIKITYKDGKFIIITSTLMDVAYGIVEVFDSNGYPIEYIGAPADRDEYVALVNKYFEHKTT